MSRPSLGTLTALGLAARLLGAQTAAAPAPALRIETPHAAVEDAHQRTVLTHRFLFKNVSSQPVAIVETYDPGGTARLALRERLLPPGAEGELLVEQPLEDRLGKVSFRYSLVTDEPGQPRYRMSLSGFVESAYDPETLRFSFPSAEPSRETSAEHDLLSREVERLEVLGFSGLPPFLEVTAARRVGLSGEGVALRAVLKAGAPLGFHTGAFQVRTNVASQPAVGVSWSANVFGDIVPSANPVHLGLVHAGEILRKEIVLRSRSGRAFEIAQVERSEARLNVTRAACDPEEAGCQRLVFTCRSDEPAALQGEVRVFVRGQAEPIPLRYVARFVSPSTTIKDLQAP